MDFQVWEQCQLQDFSSLGHIFMENGPNLEKYCGGKGSEALKNFLYLTLKTS